MVFKETKIKNIKITDERSKSKGQARLTGLGRGLI